MEANVTKKKTEGTCTSIKKREEAKDRRMGRVPAEPGVQLQGLPGHSTLPAAGSTLPTLHCNPVELRAGSPLQSQPPEEPLDLRGSAKALRN